ncbi:MAG TPA: isoaspartyl peptidase/L-asparaginase family protein [Nitrospiraceae bacterium]|nr:isoaspartyl peptidase/L-asparaginase family protein [Nitrospiraceae bacterium]
MHGGAGSRKMNSAQRVCLTEALSTGYGLLKSGETSIAAVEGSIRVLEGSGLFNAGLGSRLQLDGVRRMDASIMEGRELKAGAVAAIEGIRHPITAARLVMQETNHVLLTGPPASRFARHFRLERLPRSTKRYTVGKGDLKEPGAKKTVAFFKRLYRLGTPGLETVGAVALDQDGTVAAGASTGGIALMLPGRVGDTPLIGCGVYADTEGGAVSMTGIGETIIRLAVAKEIVDRLTTGVSPARVTKIVLERLMRKVRGSAGALVISRDGRFAIQHVTPRMAAGYWNGRGKPFVSDRFL